MRNSDSNSGFILGSRLADVAASWVHPSVETDSAEYFAHSSFIIWGTLVGSAAALFVPALLAFSGTFGGLEVAILMALSVPLLCSYIVSKTGRLDWGVVGILTSLAGVLITLSMLSGGLFSPLVVLLCIIPLEASYRLGSSGLKFGAGIAALSIPVIYVLANQLNLAPVGSAASWQIVTTVVLLAYTVAMAVRFSRFRSSISAELMTIQSQFDLISENTSDFVTRHNSAGTTLFVSPAARAVFGVAPGKLLDDGLFEKVHVQDRIIFLSNISTVANGGEEQVFQFRIRCKGAEQPDWKWVEMRCCPVAGDTLDDTRVVAATRDISQLKELQDRISNSTTHAEESDAAQRRFLAIMSHELRTPLNAILGFSDILRQELFGELPDDRQKEYVELIHDSGGHLLNLVNDLLDISRIESDKYELSPEPVSVVEIVDVTFKMLQQIAADNQVSISRDVSDSLPDLNADRRCCKQILINLVSNAIKFSSGGGEVRVSVELHEQNFMIKVADNGIGISEEFLPKIGQPFMQADNGKDREYEGTGLGLSVVKGLVELHNGTFEIESTLGEGTTVSITLPSSKQASPVVPADGQKSLVNLNEKSVAAQPAEAKTKQTCKKGDSRARVSA